MKHNKIRKVVYIDDEEYVWCSREKEYLHNENFDFNKKGEYKLFCNECSKLLYDERNINYTQGALDRNQYVEEQSKILLKNIGYDFNSELSIHEQFLIKHRLV